MRSDNSITLILKTYNNQDTIGRTINSIIEQVEIPEYKIIIQDKGSTDKTLHNIRQFQSNVDLQVVEKIEIEDINTKYFMILTAPNYLHKTSISFLLKIFEINENIGVAAPVEFDANRTIFSNAYKILYSTNMLGKRIPDYLNVKQIINVNTSQAALFDTQKVKKNLLDLPNSKYDFELTIQTLNHNGYETLIHPKAIAYTTFDSNLATVFKNNFEVSIVKMLQKRKTGRLSIKEFLPIILLVYLVLVGVASIFNVIALSFFMLFVTLYLVFVISTSIFFAFKKGIDPLITAGIIATTHLSSAIGNLIGLFSKS